MLEAKLGDDPQLLRLQFMSRYLRRRYINFTDLEKYFDLNMVIIVQHDIILAVKTFAKQEMQQITRK